MKREDFFFDSRDGKNKIHAVRWTPDETVKPVAIVQIIHGMAEHVDRYEDFAAYLVEKGMIVTADDHLGHGKSLSEGRKGYFCKQDPATVVVRDVHRLKKITQEKYTGVPYVILGHSMGSFILRNYLFRYGKGIDAAIVMGTGMPAKPVAMALKLMASIGCAFGKAATPSEFINKIAFGAYLKKIDNPRTSNDWLTKEEAIVDKYNEDSLCGFTFTCNGFKTLGELILRLHKKSNIEKMPVTLPVLFVSGSDDPVGNYGEDVKKVYKSFLDEGMQKVSINLYEGDRHEILNETDHLTVYEDLYNWIEKAI
ncbi:MAG: alpha/beta hydrolase [Lachnospiraceae bacterium]|nr:alpha/beta hydrolase [Lachnospiraceae bacterium]